MKQRGLITLLDAPELQGKGKSPATSTIVIARLDDKLSDPRYGKFAITQADVDGWAKNLNTTFGGRVAIDRDHSSDRGRGTRASGWITGLHQDGKLVTADVEWTPKGARAIRRGDYRHISATFTQRFVDEHGVNRGRALLGAALTNRPVLRDGMPALSLSRDEFDGVATLNQPAAKPASPSHLPSNPTSSRPTKKGRTFGIPKGKKAKKRAMKAWAKKQAKAARSRVADDPAVWNSKKGKGRSQANPEGNASVAAAKAAVRAQKGPKKLSAATQAELEKYLARAGEAEVKIMTAPGVDPQLRSLWADRILATTDPQPQGREINAVYAMSQGGQITPLQQRDGLGAGAEPRAAARVDPDRQALDQAARRLAKSEGIDYAEAAMAVANARQGLELAQVDGSSDLPHRDTSRPMPVSPTAGRTADGKWTQQREELFQHDLRRAGSAGVTDLSREAFDAYSEEGRDLAYELAQQYRQENVAANHAETDAIMANAKRSAAIEAAKAKNAAALDRQRTQHARAAQARQDLAHGQSQFSGASNAGDVVGW